MGSHSPGLGTDRWYLVKTQGHVKVFHRITKQCKRMEREFYQEAFVYYLVMWPQESDPVNISDPLPK